MKRKRLPDDGNVSLDMSPLIDLSFLLLVYFLVTSTLDPRESDLAMTMPDPRGTSSYDFIGDPIAISVNAAGHVIANEEVLDIDPDSREMPLLLDRLRSYAEAARLTGSRTQAILDVDDAAKGQRFIDVLNALSDPRVGIHEVALAASFTR